MRIVLFVHSLISDWNHGNAHFLRGVARDLRSRGHEVRAFEPAGAWSVANLFEERGGAAAVQGFRAAYPGLESTRYDLAALDLDRALAGADLVIVHEWNDHELVRRIGEHRLQTGADYRLLFHDTHHRSVTDRASMARYPLAGYDGVLAFGRVVRDLYLREGWARQAWIWHEAADVRIFKPLDPSGNGSVRPPERLAAPPDTHTGERRGSVVPPERLAAPPGAPPKERSGAPRNPSASEGDLVWIGNWGDEERTAELHEFLIEPVRELGLRARVYGVRYPEAARAALAAAGIEYGGWLPNYEVPAVFARFRVTVHVPRRPYARCLPGIPTIRPFEALACGIPLISAPWDDAEGLFTPGEDYLVAKDGAEMKRHLAHLLADHEAAQRLARHGRRTILERHTCSHRVDELLAIDRRLAAARRAEVATLR